MAVVALGVIAAAMFLRKPSTADKPAAQDSAQADVQEEKNETLPAQEAEDEKPVEETAAEESQEEEAAAEESQEEEIEEFDHNIPVDAISYNGHHYYFYNDVETNLTEAMDRCRDRGGYLAVINDREENNMLFEKMVEILRISGTGDAIPKAYRNQMTRTMARTMRCWMSICWTDIGMTPSSGK